MADRVPFDVQSLLLETDTLDSFLAEVAAEARRRTPGADGCGITLERKARPFTVASAGLSAPPLDDKQYDLDEGPCLEALRRDKEVRVTDMRAERRWGAYPAFAAGRGTLSSLSLPLREREGMAGALNLYAPAPDAFSAEDVAGLRLLAAQAAGALVFAVRLSDAQQFAAGSPGRPAFTHRDRPGHGSHHGAAAVHLRGGVRLPPHGLAEPERQAAGPVRPPRGERLGNRPAGGRLVLPRLTSGPEPEGPASDRGTRAREGRPIL
ncbi:ANTAR domain-containing protein [Streptomyces sp. SPB074]|nr:ANTAR domain-containing protein [Streptomyces sp. SPB074]